MNGESDTEKKERNESYKAAWQLCKFSGSRVSSYRPCPRWYRCERCEFEHALVDWKRGEPW